MVTVGMKDHGDIHARMKLISKLADDMVAMRNSIVKVYNDELCDRVDRSALIKLSRNISSLKRDLATLENRIGIEMSADPYSRSFEE